MDRFYAMAGVFTDHRTIKLLLNNSQVWLVKKPATASQEIFYCNCLLYNWTVFSSPK
jgi:hypothetical protein